MVRVGLEVTAGTQDSRSIAFAGILKNVNETQFYISVTVGPAVTMVVVLIGVLINNNRIGDLRMDVNSRMTEMRSEMNNRFSDINTRFSDMREIYRQQGEVQEANLRRVEDMLLGKFAELDNCLSRIESQGH